MNVVLFEELSSTELKSVFLAGHFLKRPLGHMSTGRSSRLEPGPQVSTL